MKAYEGATRLLKDAGVAKENFEPMLSLLKAAYVLNYTDKPDYKALQNLLAKSIDLFFFLLRCVRVDHCRWVFFWQIGAALLILAFAEAEDWQILKTPLLPQGNLL